MKKTLYTFLLLLMPVVVNANSICSVEEQSALKSEANLIKVEYFENSYTTAPGEVEAPDAVPPEDRDTYTETRHFIDISILGMSENFYVEISTDYSEYTENVYYEQFEDSIYTFEDPYKKEVVTYTFTVKSSSETSCPNEDYKIIYLTKPKYNEESTRDVCLEFPEEDICQTFTFNKNLDINSFDKVVEDLYEEINNPTEPEENDDEINNSKILIYVIVIIVIIGALAASVFVYRKRRNNEK